MDRYEEVVRAKFPKAIVEERGDYGGQYRVVVLAKAAAYRQGYQHKGNWCATPGSAWASFHRKLYTIGQLPAVPEQQS